MPTFAVAHTVVVTLLLLLGIIGCDTRNSAEEELPDRFARKYVPFEPGWIPASRIPAEPQKTPQMMIWEVSGFDPRIPPTPDQQKAADDMVQRCFDAALEKNWFDREQARADGFLTPGSDSRHHRNDAYILDRIQLDPERPEYLMYYPDPSDPETWALTGFMFLADGAETRGHQFAGPLAIWHYHIYKNARCWAERGLLPTGMVTSGGACGRGVASHRSPEMVHVWLIDHPRGPFSTGMTLPHAVLAKGLAKRKELHGF